MEQDEDVGLSPTVPTAPGASARLTAGSRLGRYVIGDRLGAGGMGMVYRAFDAELGRNLAIKVVRPMAAGPGAQARLLREAQAMAKLRHPSVVPVFDVGTVGNDVYVVMPYLEGGTLREWMARSPRTWREILDAFLAAGQGLAAAHAAGLVHRDFKPDNVLIGAGGEVQVADFGLVRVGDEEAASATTSGAELSKELTRDGEMVGTLAYMAPEQLARERADARSDQFSFCIAAWEGLLKEMPFWKDGKLRVPPSPVPARVRRVLERGLENERDDRWPSMEDLLRALDAAARPRWPYVAAIAGGAVVGTVVVLLAVQGGERAKPVCRDALARMDGVWDAERRAAVEQAFTATGAPFAAGAIERIAAKLDAHRDAWVAMHTEACEATAVHKSQTAELLERRMSCLERRRLELDALVDAMATVTQREALARAETTVEELPPLDVCDDRDLLMEGRSLPDDPEDRSKAIALDARFAAAHARSILGRDREVADDLAAIADEAVEVEHFRLAAEARLLEADLISEYDDARAVHAGELAAEFAAEAAADDITARVYPRLVQDLLKDGELDRARALVPIAKNAVTRRPTPQADRTILVMEATYAFRTGDPQTARDKYRAALEIGNTSPFQEYILMSNVAEVEEKLGHLDEAVILRRRQLGIAERLRGPEHPLYAEALMKLGRTQRLSGDVAGAEATLPDALQRLELSVGEGPLLTTALIAIANLDSSLRKHEDALARIARASAMAARHDPDTLASVLVAQSKIQMAAGDMAGARVSLESALKEYEQRVGRNHVDYAEAEVRYVEVVGCKDPSIDVTALLAHATSILAPALGPTHEAVVAPRVLAASCRRLSDKNAAEAALLDLLATCTNACDARQVISIGASLANVEWELGKKEQAMARMRALREEAAAINPPPHLLLKQIDQWLATP